MSDEVKNTKTTIGIPVYNEIRFIERTIMSALGQADQIVISDNASTDGTSELCQEYAEKYPEIKYFRYEKNMGGAVNFNNCVELADNNYFMWLGGHDLISENYVKELKKILDTTDAILAYSNSVHLSQEYSFNNRYEYNYYADIEDNNSAKRVFAIIAYLGDCTVLHGLYKKEFLKEALKINNNNLESIDHGLLCEVARLGKMKICEDVTFYRIDPRESEEDCMETWRRVMKSIYQDKYDPNIHIPEKIPINISFVQMDIAVKVAHYMKMPKVFLYDVKKCLLQRWGVNDYAIKKISNLENFIPIKNIYHKKNLIDKIAWWIPIRKCRDAFRNKFRKI